MRKRFFQSKIKRILESIESISRDSSQSIRKGNTLYTLLRSFSLSLFLIKVPKNLWGGFNLENGNLESLKWLSRNPVLSDPIKCFPTNPSPTPHTYHTHTHTHTRRVRGGLRVFSRLNSSLPFREDKFRESHFRDSRYPYSRLITFPKKR